MEWIVDKDRPAIYPFAGFFRRGVALGVDWLIAHWLTAPILSLLAFLTDNGPMTYTVKTAIFLAYFTVLTKLNHGQTIGKMLLGLQVIRRDRGTLTWTDVLLRETCGRYLSQTCLILYFLPLFAEEKLSLSDYFAQTRVVKIEAYRSLDEDD